jgi:glycosyltransferase involved in cell wall biosynthesis
LPRSTSSCDALRCRPPPRARARAEAALRLALIGAFAFPLAQGSQLYARDQALALRAAGADVTLFCYGAGSGPDPAGLPLVRIPRLLTPRRLRAGPSLGKPLADAALVAALVRAQRARPFDLALAHNGEAGLVALCARSATGLRFVYVAHTLLGLELSSYAAAALRPALDRAGRRIDRMLAARADGVLALSSEAAKQLGAEARGPLAVIPPGLDPAPEPAAEEIARACARFGLTPGGFALYAGNLDAYQELPDLAAAARRLAPLPVVVATQQPEGSAPAPLRLLRPAGALEERALVCGAAVAVLPRRIPGGFPIKLLNYMEAGRAIVAHAAVASALEHDREAWLLAPGAGPEELAGAIRALERDPARAARLGRGARAALAARFAWPALLERTLALCRATLTGGDPA